MVVSIGMRLQNGPWGGGNQFGTALAGYLRAHGVTVEFDLKRPDIDIIVLTEPRRELRSCAYDDRDIAAYRAGVNSHVVVIHRVNECDERKGTSGVNARLREANAVADTTVFISSWLMDLHVHQGMKAAGKCVILNGADSTIFYPGAIKQWHPGEPLRLVTHHWGANRLKGFDIYGKIDGMLADPRLRALFSFTYVGNMPDGVHLPHTRVVAPLSGKDLADELRHHHVYVTGSENEPAGMHHIEGASCGLPLLFRCSGALPEYCSAFGIGFNGDDFPQALHLMMMTYHVWVDRVRSYPYSAERMCEQYLTLFNALASKNTARTAVSWPAWVNDTVQRLLPFVAGLEDRSVPGRYHPAREGVTPTGNAMGLGFAALATKLLVILGLWRTMSTEDRACHIDFLKSFQRNDTGGNGFWCKGAFVDMPLVEYLKTSGEPGTTPAESIGRVVRAESKQAIATLAEVCASPKLRYVDVPSTPMHLQESLEGLGWERPWNAGGQASGIVTLLATGHGSSPRSAEHDLLETARAFFRSLVDPATGAYFRGPQPEHGNLINGAMKVLTALDWLEEPIHAPERLIDTCLSALPQHEGCHLVDVVYVLNQCSRQTDHRRKDIVAYCTKLLEMIRLHHNADGGFSYWIGRSQTTYYGAPITVGMPVSDIHGTLLLVWALAMVTHMIDDDRFPAFSVIRP